MKIKILFVIYNLSAGGGEKALVNLLNSLSPKRYDIDLQMFEDSGINKKYLPEYVNVLPPLYENGMPTGTEILKVALKKKNFRMMFSKIWYTLRAVGKSDRKKTYYAWQTLKKRPYINSNTYDVAVAGMHGLVTYFTMDCTHAKRKICWIHTDYSKISKVPEEKEYFQRADKIVVVSKQCMEAFRAVFPNVDNVEIVYNLNCPKMIHKMAGDIRPAEYRGDFGTIIVSVGRLVRLKGFDLAIAAGEQLKKEGIEFRWFILGEGVMREELETLAAEMGVASEMRFVGMKENPYPYLKFADIVVQPSRYEGKSMVLDEAKILGCPIVATSYDSVKDQIVDGENGIITEISRNAIAEGIKKMIQDQQLREHIKQNLRTMDTDESRKLEKYDALFEGKNKDEEIYNHN